MGFFQDLWDLIYDWPKKKDEIPSDAWDNFLTWLAAEIVKKVAEAVVEAVRWLVAELRYWKHKLFETLANWLGSDLAFIILAGLTIGISILFPKIRALVESTGISAAYKALVESIRKGLGKVSELIHLVDLQAINRIAMMVWPEWREIMVDLSDATSALAEELGQGSGYIHAYFSVIHSLAIVGSAVTGFPAEVAELRAFEDTDRALRRINDRFREYAHDPGKIIRDIIEECYIPYATEIRDTQTGLISEVREVNTYAVNLDAALRRLDNSLANFIAVQPEEMREIIEQRLGPFERSLNQYLTWLETDILPVFAGSIEALEDRADIIERVNTRLQAELDDPRRLFVLYSGMSPEDQAAYASMLAAITMAAQDAEAAETMPSALDAVDQVLVSAVVPVTPGMVMPSMGYEPAGIVPAVRTAAEREKDWFVGEW